MIKQSERYAEKRWVWALILAFALFLSAAWIVFDELFAPMESSGETVTVPDYTGAASESLSPPAWLTVRTEYRYNAEVPAGEVISQSPVGGSRRKITNERPQCEVRLTVSLGEEHVYLPNVVGEDVRVAEAALREAGFAVESIFSTGAYPEGEVLAMRPVGGRELPRGSRVTLSVSAGVPAVTVTVPDLRGMQREEALTALWLSQLALDRVIEEDSMQSEGTVIRQNYQPDTVVMAGTKLTLYVSRRRE